MLKLRNRTSTEVPRVLMEVQLPIHKTAVYRGNTVFSPTSTGKKSFHYTKQML